MADTSTVTAGKPSWQQENELRTKELTDKLEAGIQELFSSDKYKEYLKSMSHLGWTYSNERATKLIGFIKNHLKDATAVEGWHYWIGDGRDLSEGIRKQIVLMDQYCKAYKKWSMK